MDIKERLKEKLDKYEIKFLEEENSIMVKGGDKGFDVVLSIEEESDNPYQQPYIVFYGFPYHEHFKEAEEAIKCFMFGLSNKCRLKVEYCGGKAYKSIIEYKDDNGEWKVDSETGALFKPFWKKKSVKYLQNNRL